MLAFSRRFIVRQAAMLSLVATSPLRSKASATADLESNARSAHLESRRTALIAQRSELDRRWLAVYERLPAWCRSGQKYIDQSGNVVDPIVGWPAANPAEAIPLDDGSLLVRPGPSDLRVLFEVDTATTSRHAAETKYRIRSKQLISRLRTKRAYLAVYRLPTSQDWVAIDHEIEAIEDGMVGALGSEALEAALTQQINSAT